MHSRGDGGWRKGEVWREIIEPAAVVVDCREPTSQAAFYQKAYGGEIVRCDEDSTWLQAGGMTVIFRKVEGYLPPTWPSPDVPMQVHLDFFTDDLEQAEAELHRHGATTPDCQPHRQEGLIVMRDPAGHLFCISRRQ